MATYTLNNSAGDIDDALQKVVAVTTTPLDGNPNMVTSGGVKAYVDTQDTALEAQILANTAAIAGNAGSGVKTAKLTAPDRNSSSDFTFPFTVSSDPDSLVSVTNGVVSLPNAGTYFVGFSGSFSSTYHPTNYHILVFYRKTSEIFTRLINGSRDGISFNYVTIETSGDASFNLKSFEVGTSTIAAKNVSMYVIKLA
jgi:hypothetical protein